MKNIKLLPRCKCGHDNSEHLRTVCDIHRCNVCDCKKWEWDRKNRYRAKLKRLKFK